MDSRTCGLSSCSSRALLERGLSSCGTEASLPCGMWDLQGLGIKPKSHALTGRFLTTGPQGKVKSLSHVRLFATPATVAYQAPLYMGFSRQEYWSGLPFPSPGDLPNVGIEPRSPALQADAWPGSPRLFFFIVSLLSVTMSCLTDTMDWSTPSFLHHLPEFSQTHVHWVSDTIQALFLSSPSPPAFRLSQYQGLSQRVSSSHQVTEVLELQHQAPSGLISFRTDWFDPLAVQGTLKRLLQHYNLKA